MTPGIGGAILSAILHGVSEYTNGKYDNYIPQDRYPTGHGAFQIVGIPLSIAFGIVAGAAIGALYRLINSYQYNDQYRD